MKWTFVIQQKLKVALLLGAIMTLIIIANILERKNIEQINQSFSSIYNDRLIPATDIFYLTENLYRKQLLMETYLLSGRNSTREELQQEIHQYNTAIDSLIKDFEKTYLVTKESHLLAAFKTTIRDYELVEGAIIDLSLHESRSSAQHLYNSKGKNLLQTSIQHLNELTAIQSDIGNELMKGSRSVVKSSHLLSTLQIVIAVVIGMMIQVLVFSSKLINRSDDQFKMN
jgi:hypothetical protein